jgi:hypothetical protein
MLLRPRPVAVVARTAVVAGTASAVSNRVSRRQSNRSESQPQQQDVPAPASAQPAAQQPPGPAASDTSSEIEQLQEFAQLHEQGILTDEEFAAKKQQILGI